jgi:hypothetical protein
MPERESDRTLILEIALPDFYLGDWDEILSFYEGGEETLAMIENESGLCSLRVKISLLIGGKDGTFVERVDGQILAAKVVTREPAHELAADDRLDDIEAVA